MPDDEDADLSHDLAQYIELIEADQLWDGEMESFDVGDAEVLLVKVDGQIRAYDGICPHQGVSLVEGELEGEVLTCRAHGWQFDVRSGASVNPRGSCLRRHDVRVTDGMVEVRLRSTVDGAANTQRQDESDGAECPCPRSNRSNLSKRDEGTHMAVIEMDIDLARAHDLVGPVIRAGNLAAAVIEAVESDNPGRDVLVLDRDDYVRIHTSGQCRLTQASLVRSLGRPYQLAALEIDMPSFKGRLRSRTDEYVWFYKTQATPAQPLSTEES